MHRGQYYMRSVLYAEESVLYAKGPVLYAKGSVLSVEGSVLYAGLKLGTSDPEGNVLRIRGSGEQYYM